MNVIKYILIFVLLAKLCSCSSPTGLHCQSDVHGKIRVSSLDAKIEYTEHPYTGELGYLLTFNINYKYLVWPGSIHQVEIKPIDTIPGWWGVDINYSILNPKPPYHNYELSDFFPMYNSVEGIDSINMIITLRGDFWTKYAPEGEVYCNYGARCRFLGVFEWTDSLVVHVYD